MGLCWIMFTTSFVTCQTVSLSQTVETHAFVDLVQSWVGVEKHGSVALHAASCPLWNHTCINHVIWRYHNNPSSRINKNVDV